MAANSRKSSGDTSGDVLTAFLHTCRSPTGIPVQGGHVTIGNENVRTYTGEFWTSRQRQGGSIHEVSYRACFKPELPRFFISLLTKQDDVVYDPFSGRGTTILEAGLLGRNVIANDANPLSRVLSEPRLTPPRMAAVEKRLKAVPLEGNRAEIDLSMFYHPKTEQEIVALREYLQTKREDNEDDAIDRWIAMVATNRLTGHSKGFFSVYTLPPNQAVSQQSQRKINEKRSQVPEYRNTRAIIIRKTKSLLRTLTDDERGNLVRAGEKAVFISGDARNTAAIPDASIQLTVTSPPFLDIVQYRDDNWLRCWFNGLDEQAIGKTITMARTLEDWTAVMGEVFNELYRITRPGGYVAFEVGEVRKRTIRLEEQVLPLGMNAGFSCTCIMINQQDFTKTSNIWGISNNKGGTNTNRIVVFRRS